ncbi:MAG: EpsI family protein [Planctomycetales bacterium]
MGRYLPVVAGLLLIGAGTWVQGNLSLRWSDNTAEELQAVVDRYPSIPNTVGVWESTELMSSKAEIEEAGGYAHVSRFYRNTETGDEVKVFLICGYARNVAVHTPDNCWAGNGYTMRQQQKKMEIPTSGKPAEAFTATFVKQRGSELTHERVFWSCTDGERWQAPKYPRITFANTVLNKIYLISQVSNNSNLDASQDPSVQFGKLFLPLVLEKLYPAGQPDADPAS